LHNPAPLPDKIAAFGVNGGGSSGIRARFTTHPPPEDRIAALNAAF